MRVLQRKRTPYKEWPATVQPHIGWFQIRIKLVNFFQRMKSRRFQWVATFACVAFVYAMRSTQRVESINHAMKHMITVNAGFCALIKSTMDWQKRRHETAEVANLRRKLYKLVDKGTILYPALNDLVTLVSPHALKRTIAQAHQREYYASKELGTTTCTSQFLLDISPLLLVGSIVEKLFTNDAGVSSKSRGTVLSYRELAVTENVFVDLQPPPARPPEGSRPTTAKRKTASKKSSANKKERASAAGKSPAGSSIIIYFFVLFGLHC